MPIYFLIFLIIAIIIIYYYNSLVRKKNIVAQCWSDIDVHLRKRYNLIPNLLSTVEGYATHEKETLENVVKLRSEAIDAKTIKSQQIAENKLADSLYKLLIIAEQYPDLKANVNFIDLQKKLLAIEKDIEEVRERYNVAVRENNIMIESFPANQVAKLFNFEQASYFKLESDLERELYRVDFKKSSDSSDRYRDTE